MAATDFTPVTWDETLIDDCRHLIRLAVREDLSRGYDLTTLALVPHDARGVARLVCRQAGVVAGLPAAELALREMNAQVDWQPQVTDGAAVNAGTTLAELQGQVRDLLTTERLLLNLLGRLSGIATLTRRFVDAIAGTGARIYDTRKTTPGWRRLEKYAVRCGGGCNHRTGLFDAILIKDNHLAQGKCQVGVAIEAARRFLHEQGPIPAAPTTILIEIEVDTLEQLDVALSHSPDLILLDNMTLDQLRAAIQRRDALGLAIPLEASGGVNLQTVRAIAETGVDRISVGALTHAASSLDVALDWQDET